jgi:hypothetical protein
LRPVVIVRGCGWGAVSVQPQAWPDPMPEIAAAIQAMYRGGSLN